MRRKIISRQLQDQQRLNIQELQAQLKECQVEGTRQFLSSSRNYKSMTFKKTPKKKVHQSIEQFCSQNSSISNTEEPLSSSQSYQTNEESASTVKIARSPSNASQFYIESANKLSMLRRRKKKYKELNDVIMNQKVNRLKETFCQKLKRNNPFSMPVDYNSQGDAFEKTFMSANGIELKQAGQKLVSLFCIFNILSSIFIFTISIVFPEISEVLAIRIIEILGAAIFLLQFVLNFITIKFSLGRKLQSIREISRDYFGDKFGIDFINLIIVLAYLSTEIQVLAHFRMIVLLKLPDCMDKIERLQVYFIENYYNEQYWSLIKVFLFNFCIAHMLAILLVGMSSVSFSNNWLLQKNLMNAPWYQKYIWSYYWGTTIMLTIGFGDIVPVCYQEALCMIFIETISCIVLAYNINCVGSLIANIRSQDIVKSKNMKIFKKLADKNDISEPLTWKINNYLEEHTNIKKLFNIQEQAQFVSRLPTTFRTDYLKEANKAIFQKVFFFNQLMEKTLLSLAQRIQMKIAHPQEVILSVERNLDVFILKNGQIGYVSKKGNRKFSKNIFDRKKIQDSNAPFLLNTNFITKNYSNYDIKSLLYSVLYYLEYDSLIEIFREAHADYQMYCKQRDKNKHRIDEFQVFPCEFCPHQKHTKFSCPKLHFIPLPQHVINRYLFKEKQDKNKRLTSFSRIQLPKQTSLTNFLFNKDIYNEKKNEFSFSNMGRHKKSKEFVIQQLKSFDNEELQNEEYIQQPISLQAITRLQYNFLENTTETIRNQINKALGVEKGEDDVWLLDLDRMKNYKSYFTENNPCNLLVAFNLDDRMKRQAERNLYDKITSIFVKSSSNLGFESLMSNSKVETAISRSGDGHARQQ